jgi:hypothetical protein
MLQVAKGVRSRSFAATVCLLQLGAVPALRRCGGWRKEAGVSQWVVNLVVKVLRWFTGGCLPEGPRVWSELEPTSGVCMSQCENASRGDISGRSGGHTLARAVKATRHPVMRTLRRQAGARAISGNGWSQIIGVCGWVGAGHSCRIRMCAAGKDGMR